MTAPLYQPDPILLAYLALTSLGYFLILIVIALTRLFAGYGVAARTLALCSLLLALAGIAAVYLPPLLGVYTGPVYKIAWTYRLTFGPLGMCLLASVPLILAAVLDKSRCRKTDIFHAVLLLGVIGLWVMTQ